jgi:8-oxo-dGTP diphosphatase
VEVAVGLLRDGAGRVLVGRRGSDVHLPGLQEFPGGKLAVGEGARDALARELREELGIDVLAAFEILTIAHDYPDRSVLLHVYRVHAWSGVIEAREGQVLEWVDPDRLDAGDFPVASKAIVNAARLPDFYLISPDPAAVGAIDAEVERVDRRLARGGIGLLQIRAPGLQPAAFLDYARALMQSAARHGVATLINAPQSLLDRLPPTGWHLTERRLLSLSARPRCAGWLAASVHDRETLMRAMALPVDFVVAGPVKPTLTHPGARPLGLQGFADLRARASCPVFALGGLTPGDLRAVHEIGAQGIAAIRGLLT